MPSLSAGKINFEVDDVYNEELPFCGSLQSKLSNGSMASEISAVSDGGPSFNDEDAQHDTLPNRKLSHNLVRAGAKHEKQMLKKLSVKVQNCLVLGFVREFEDTVQQRIKIPSAITSIISHFAVDQRAAWGKGDQVEVFSNTDQSWYLGEISQDNEDDDGDWIECTWLSADVRIAPEARRRWKSLKRFSTDIRPVQDNFERRNRVIDRVSAWYRSEVAELFGVQL